MKKLLALVFALALLLCVAASAEYKVPGDDVIEYIQSKGYHVSIYEFETDNTNCSLSEGDDAQTLALMVDGKMCFVNIKINEYWTNYQDIRHLFYELVSGWKWDTSSFVPNDDGESEVPVSFGLLPTARPHVDYPVYDDYVQALYHALQTTPPPLAATLFGKTDNP